MITNETKLVLKSLRYIISFLTHTVGAHYPQI